MSAVVSDAARRDMAELVRRYLDRADTDDHRAAIMNLAGLLRHATAYAAALTREIEHYAAEARDALARVADLQSALDEVLLDNAALQARIQELEAELFASRDD